MSAHAPHYVRPHFFKKNSKQNSVNDDINLFSKKAKIAYKQFVMKVMSNGIKITLGILNKIEKFDFH